MPRLPDDVWMGVLALMMLVSVSAGSTRVRASTPAEGFFEQHCYSCHDADMKEGGLDLTALTLRLDLPENFARWEKIHDRVASGEMPPARKARPNADELRSLLAALDPQLIAADAARQAQSGRAVFRRLTRSEYENSLRELLVLPHLEVQAMLPADGTRHGYDKIGDALDLSHVQLAKYLEAADRALDLAICTQPEPPSTYRRRIFPASSFKFIQALGPGNGVLLKDKQPDPQWPAPGPYLGGTWVEGVRAARAAGVPASESAVGLFIANTAGWQTSTTFAPIHAGNYRLRFSTWSFHWNAGEVEPAARMETAMLYASAATSTGARAPNSGPRTLGYFDAPSLESREHELTVWLHGGEEVIFDPASFIWRGQQVRQKPGGAAAYVGPGLALDWFEAEGPIFSQWPAESHRRLFGDLPIAPFDPASGLAPPEHAAPAQVKSHTWPRLRDLPAGERDVTLHTVRSVDPRADATRLLAAFLPRAFRREVTRAEVERYVGIMEERMKAGECFELAMRQAYRTALTSTQFLFRREVPGPLDDHALATRLALWLWNSPPDDALLALARTGRLREPATVRAQVERLLADERSERFVTDFLDQWLGLRNIDFTDPDKQLYPEFHLYLRDSMLAESRAFFRELVTRDLGAAQLVVSDFLMLNQRMAEHYGIAGVVGSAMRRVPVPPGSPRGGIITQASVLKVTANGTTTSPVVRGAWLADRILGQPIPPPPPGIPTIDPDTRGATTIREQLDRHRADVSCASCHTKMDPPGFALEAFDVIGGFRDRYRSFGQGEAPGVVYLDGWSPRFLLGPPVDPSGELADGRTFADVHGLRRLLVAEPEALARNLVEQLVAYATGATPSYADRRAIDRLLAQTRASGHGVRSLIHAIAQCDIVQNK